MYVGNKHTVGACVAVRTQGRWQVGRGGEDNALCGGCVTLEITDN